MKRPSWFRLLCLGATLLCAPATSAQTAPFTVDVRYLGKALNASQQATVREAAARVSALIASPFVSVTLDLPANSCDSNLPRIREKVQRFFVFVRVTDLGEDKYAEAAPCELQDDSYLPIYGVIDLNANVLGDLPRVDLLDTMIHEMLHALGVGTLWEADYRVSISGDSDDKNLIKKVSGKYYYTGAKALAAYQNLGGKVGAGTGIPLDADGGHWAGRAVCSEILSGDAGDYTGRVNPVSPLTLGALEDLGYRVNRAAANRYTLPLKGCPDSDEEEEAAEAEAAANSVFFASCAAARAAGVAPIRRGQPGYRAAMDGDGDGVACE
ncbi:excalibur calcium-binding domain-containing protein [Deinococcus sp. QL22]|uniref:excalibur calcium-binding domain-containing protein n=1 Tax=Deinococcus sp. QL22 TaxID=2939437 RepID=UPI002016E689|nr:excalibur calcium-binding domain-containing protein [Deinococcus sp. QL22]UQN06832.1 excalibur calcium-binding domain-containing protein [Deinococcus sp. QL22]